jgi:hydroxyacylglutathione hydrolase
MFLHRVETAGLAHWSYYLEDAGEAIVIDPRRDPAVYADLARSRGARIVAVLETHRQEDVVAGSVELAERTGAAVYHADGELDYEYGTAVEDGQYFALRFLRAQGDPHAGSHERPHVLPGADRADPVDALLGRSSLRR